MLRAYMDSITFPFCQLLLKLTRTSLPPKALHNGGALPTTARGVCRANDPLGVTASIQGGFNPLSCPFSNCILGACERVKAVHQFASHIPCVPAYSEVVTHGCAEKRSVPD